MENNSPTLLISSEGFPPLLDASAVLVNNIFSKYPGKMFAIAGNNFTKYDPTFEAPCKTWYIRFPRNRFTQAISMRFHILFLPLYCMYVEYVVKKVKPDVIFNNYPHEVLFVATYKIAKKHKIPMFVYMHDLWEENMVNRLRKSFAQKWEKEILSHSDLVFCCTSSQQLFYKKKYNIDSELLLHPIPDEEIDAFEYKSKKKNEKITIAYSGSISSHMNQDAFVMLSKAMDLLPENYEFKWLPITPISEEMLKSLDISSPKIKLKYVDRNQLKNELSESDIMFAPLSHKNCSLTEVNTVFSNKLLGYLVSGRPILVFAPPDCHHVEIAKAGNWGYIVDKDDAQSIADGILELVNNEPLSATLISNALKEAKKRRSSTQAKKIYEAVLKLKTTTL